MSNEEKISLNNPISPKEIISSIKNFKPYKAPGPNGFHSFFFQKYLHNTLPAIKTLIQEIFTLIVSRPASTKPLYAWSQRQNVQIQFLNLCNTIYKILTNIIVARLRPVLCNLIDPYQSSFLPNQRAADNFILVQETLKCFDKRKPSQTKLMAIKIDLGNSLDVC